MQQYCEILQESWWLCLFVALILIFFIALVILLFFDWQFHVVLRNKERERISKVYRRAAKAGAA